MGERIFFTFSFWRQKIVREVIYYNFKLKNIKIIKYISENTLSENTLSENTLSENTLSENTLSENTLL